MELKNNHQVKISENAWTCQYNVARNYISNSIFQVSYRNGECTSKYYLEGEAGINIFKGYSVYVLIDHFLFPALCFLFLYGK